MSDNRKKVILVVDDNPTNVKLAVDLLQLNGFETLTATNGKEALQRVTEKQPDVILLDIMMPELDGYQVCRELKSSKETQFIPVVMITSLSEKEDKIRGIEAGADDFISKPFDKDELLARVKSLLRIKSLHDELEESYKKLQELEQLKNNLTHMIVHDLNNPLMVISGSLQLLDMGIKEILNDEQKKDLELALIASRNLKRMVSNLLDVNKMEEGKITLRPENFNLGELAQEVVEQMMVVARREEKVLSVEVGENIPIVTADKELIRRVIANLLNNAIKFTPARGTIHTGVSYSPGDNGISVQVKDSGEGIPADYLDKIFDKFSQVETKNARKGKGLGLTFCKMAVQAHGGKITVESEPGRGSTFTFLLPLYGMKGDTDA